MQAQFLSQKTKGRDYMEDRGKDVNIRLKCIFKELTCVCVNWIHLAQDRDYVWMLWTQ